MTTKKFHISNFILLLFIALASCVKETKINNIEELLPDNIVELRDDQIKLAKIETGSIQIRRLSGSLKVNGVVSVAPQNLATVCMPMGGFIKNTTLMPGNSIRKGQLLAIIENQDFIDMQQNYLETKNKLEFAQAEYNRHAELYKDDVYSQKNLQQVSTEYRNLKGQAKALEQKLALIGINASQLTAENISRSVQLLSPISGYIKAVNVSIGKSVSSADILFEIVNTDKLFLELTLFEKEAEKILIGQKLHFYINNESEQHEASIYQTSKLINDDKTYKVYANVSSNCKNMMPGMYVNALIETVSQKVNTLPNEAFVNFDDKDYIFVIEKTKNEKGKLMTEYRMIEVKKGLTQNGFTEIISPEILNIKNCKVVIKNAYNLLSAKKNAGEMSC